MSPVLILIFIFCYVPMYGLLISFQDWTPGMPFMDFTGQTKWVGLKHFSTFVHDPYFWRLIKNTLVLSAMNLGIAFWIPIIFSLLINEVRLVKFKKFAQTASYMPYFISSVVVAGMALSFLSSDGIINKFIMMMGGEPFLLNMKPQYFPIVYTVINIWRNFGWGSILYLSSMASIDPTIVAKLIMGLGGMLGADSDMILLLYNPATYEYADVIGTYLYRYGLVGGNFSYGTAVGFMIALINFGMVYLANMVSRKVADYSLW